MPREQVAKILRRDFLVTEERADKLSGAWGQHPLLGRMYLPAYRAGTEKIAELRRTHAPDQILPAIYGCSGLVDIVTVDEEEIANAILNSFVAEFDKFRAKFVEIEANEP